MSHRTTTSAPTVPANGAVTCALPFATSINPKELVLQVCEGTPVPVALKTALSLVWAARDQARATALFNDARANWSTAFLLDTVGALLESVDEGLRYVPGST